MNRTTLHSTTLHSQTLNTLVDHNFKLEDETEDNPQHTNTRLSVSKMEKKDALFRTEEIQWTTNGINKGKAPGQDGLPTDIIEEVYLANKPLFHRFRNMCYKRGYFPKGWKSANLVQARENPKDCDNYRPIAL